MFGWEFPPHISGGLGTACYGLTRGMSVLPDLDILFVVPKAYGDEDQSRISLLGAGDVSVDIRKVRDQKFLQDLSYIEISSNLVPYTSPEEYEELVNRAENKGKRLVETTMGGKLSFTGKYGKNLYEEIANYAIVAGEIALKEDFDIIHSHDWLTYPAGIAAKRASGGAVDLLHGRRRLPAAGQRHLHRRARAQALGHLGCFQAPGHVRFWVRDRAEHAQARRMRGRPRDGLCHRPAGPFSEPLRAAHHQAVAHVVGGCRETHPGLRPTRAKSL